MNKNLLSIRTLFVFIILSFMAFDNVTYAQKKKKKKKSKKEKDTPVVSIEEPSKKDLRKAEELFIYAVNEYLLEEYNQALELLLKCNNLNGKDDGIKYQTALTYQKLENYQRSQQFAKRALELDPNNKYYYQLVAQNFEILGLYKDALQVLETQILKTGDDEEAYFQIAMLYLQMGAPRNAIEYFDKGEEIYGINDIIVRQKQRIYIRLGDLDAALAEGDKLIKAFPDNLDFKYSQVRLLLGNNKTDAAREMLEPILQDYPNEGEGHFLLANIYRNQGESEKYFEELKIAFGSDDALSDESFNILAGYLQFTYNEKKRKEGEELIKTALESHPNNDRVLAIYGDFQVSVKKYDEARKYYLESLNINPDNFKLWQQVLSIDWELQETDSVNIHADLAIEYFPNQAILYFYSGSSKLFLEEYEEAEVMLNQGLQIVVDPTLKIQFNAQLGDTYYKLDDYKKAFDKYEEVLKVDPINLYVLNNYSYFLSLRKENLEKAEEMSHELILAEPENDTYLDTYGWVLFVREKYSEAEKVLGKAAGITKSGTVLEHYGDVLYKVDKKEEAIKYWKKAKEVGDEVSDKLDEKIKKGIYISE